MSEWSELTLNILHPAGSQGFSGLRCSECPCSHTPGYLQMAREPLHKVTARRPEMQLVHIKELRANIWVCHSLPALNVF